MLGCMQSAAMCRGGMSNLYGAKNHWVEGQWHAYGAAAAGPWQGQSACQVDDPIEIEERPVDVYGAFCRGGPLKWS